MLDDTVLIAVAPALIPLEWTEDVEDTIDAANDRLPGDKFDATRLRADCLTGRRQLWIVKRDDVLLGLGVTGIEVDEATERRTLHLMLTAGRDWSSWAWTLGAIEAWGRENGCSRCRIEGRKGWWRRLPDAYRLTGETCGPKGFVWERTLLNG